MKSLDFLKEGFVEDANEAHQDHEVQMARQECFHAAEHALALHKLLRNISEAQGLEGWVSSKITLANDYLRRVREYLEYELLTKDIDDVATNLSIAEDQDSKKKNQLVEYKIAGAEAGSENYSLSGIDQDRLQSIAASYYGKPVEFVASKDDPKLYNINVQMTVGPIPYGQFNAATGTATLAKRMTDKGDQLYKVMSELSEAQTDAERAEAERQMQDFVSRGGEIQQVKAQPGPRRSGASLGSKHIGGRSEVASGKTKGRIRGLGSSPTGKAVVATEQGVAEGSDGKVVFAGTAADGRKYEIIQTSPYDFIIHANGKHIDTYQSLQRAMSVLKNEVPGLQQGVAEGTKCNHTMEGTKCPVHGLMECPGYKSTMTEMSAGSVATVVNPPAKNKSKVGTLFGGTYKQKKVKEAMAFPGENTKPPQRPGDQVRGSERATKPNPFKHRLVGNE